MEDTKGRILTAAAQLFEQQGYRSVSMRAIAAQLGISVGNLTYHVPHKQDIATALAEQELKTIILPEGTDYRIEVRGGNGQWYRRHLTSAETRRPVRPAAGRLITICRHIWRCMLGNGQLRIRKAVQNESGHFWNISQL